MIIIEYKDNNQMVDGFGLVRVFIWWYDVKEEGNKLYDWLRKREHGF